LKSLEGSIVRNKPSTYTIFLYPSRTHSVYKMHNRTSFALVLLSSYLLEANLSNETQTTALLSEHHFSHVAW